MRVFLSWSGERSRTVATALKDWLPLVLHYTRPWLSDTDIHAGERWAQLVARELSESSFGILCLTPENLDSAWMLFEAGALAKSLETSRVVPVLLDLDLSDLAGPLAQFQAKKLTKDGIRAVVDSVQASTVEGVPSDRLGSLFEPLWPVLENQLAAIEPSPDEARATRPVADVLEELVASVRSLHGDLRTTEQRLALTLASRGIDGGGPGDDPQARLDEMRRRAEFGGHYERWRVLGDTLSKCNISLGDRWHDPVKQVFHAWRTEGVSGLADDDEDLLDRKLLECELGLRIQVLSADGQPQLAEYLGTATASG